MQIYDITIGVNSTRRLDAPGTYFYYYSGSAGGADSTITLQGISSGLRIVLKPGQSLRLPDGANVETSWLVGNYANTASIIGTVIVGNGQIQDNRISGSVEVIDGGKNRTAANQTFFGYANAGLLAGNFSHQQLWNPAASGKNLFVKALTISTSVAQAPQLAWSNSAMTTLVTTGGSPKKIGGTAGSAEQRSQTNAAQLGTSLQHVIYLAANTPLQIQFQEPIQIPPGFGLVTRTSVVAADLPTVFEYMEESV